MSDHYRNSNSPQHSLGRLIPGVLIVLLATFSVWLGYEHLSFRQRAHSGVRGQAQMITASLEGGIRSQGRFRGRRLERIQASFEEISRFTGVVAIGLLDEQGQVLVQAGHSEAYRAVSSPQLLTTDRYQYVHVITIAPRFFQDEPESSTSRPSDPRPRRHGRFRPDRGGHQHRWGRRRGGGGRHSEHQQKVSIYVVLDTTEAQAEIQRDLLLRLGLWGSLLLILLILLFLVRKARESERLSSELAINLERNRFFQDLSMAGAGLAHETKNPLGIVRGMAQMLSQSGSVDDEERAQARQIVEEVDRISSRINEFLSFSKPPTPKLVAIKLSQLLASLHQLLLVDLEEKQLQLDIRGDATVRADRELLRQAVFNLIHNAVWASGEGGAITCIVTDDNAVVSIAISDQGAGVAEPDVDNLFKPYFSTRPGGTGLGLAIVRQICLNHGWSVGYRPHPGGGATFTITGLERVS